MQDADHDGHDAHRSSQVHAIIPFAPLVSPFIPASCLLLHRIADGRHARTVARKKRIVKEKAGHGRANVPEDMDHLVRPRMGEIEVQDLLAFVLNEPDALHDDSFLGGGVRPPVPCFVPGESILGKGE